MKLKVWVMLGMMCASQAWAANSQVECQERYKTVITSVELIARDDVPAPQEDKAVAKKKLKDANQAAKQGDYCRAVTIVFDNSYRD